MTLRIFFKKNWLTILSIILAIFVSAYFYAKSVKEREPVFLVDPIRIAVPGTAKNNPMAVRFYFWNEGKESIKQSNILQKLKIELDDPSGDIVDFKLVKISREITGLKLSRDPAKQRQALDLNFSILEENDGTMGQIIYTGTPNAAFSISGIIEGAHKIKTNSSIEHAKFWVEFFKYPAILLGYIVIVVLVQAALNFITSKVSAAAEFLNVTMGIGAKRTVAACVAIIVITVCSVAIYRSLPGTIKKLQINTRENVTRAVPFSISPEETIQSKP